MFNSSKSLMSCWMVGAAMLTIGAISVDSGVLASSLNESQGEANLLDQHLDTLFEQGLNCDTANLLQSLDDMARDQLMNRILTDVGEDGFNDLLTLGGGCPGGLTPEVLPLLPLLDPLHIQAGLAPNATWKGESIEEASSTSGTAPKAILRDSSSYGWMCNGGAAENPADYIAYTYIKGAYANRTKLRVRGTHTGASCMIPASSSARVYDNDYIYMCVGYWSASGCLEIVETSDIRTWY